MTIRCIARGVPTAKAEGRAAHHGAGQIPRWKARVTNTAIWSRLTVSSGA